jgi:hypothetical protein
LGVRFFESKNVVSLPSFFKAKYLLNFQFFRSKNTCHKKNIFSRLSNLAKIQHFFTLIKLDKDTTFFYAYQTWQRYNIFSSKTLGNNTTFFHSENTWQHLKNLTLENTLTTFEKSSSKNT